MWFIESIPSNLKQEFVVKSIQLGRQQTEIVASGEFKGHVAIPFPYTYGKQNGSLEIVSSNGFSKVSVHENIRKMYQYLYENPCNIQTNYSIIISDAKKQYANDDIGWILCEMDGVENTKEHTFSICYKHKIHYSSSLWIPTQVSPLHYTKQTEGDTSIRVYNGLLSTYPKNWSVSWEDDIIVINIPNSIFDTDISITTINWESSDDEIDVQEQENEYETFDRKHFLQTVGIF